MFSQGEGKHRRRAKNEVPQFEMKREVRKRQTMALRSNLNRRFASQNFGYATQDPTNRKPRIDRTATHA